MTAQIFAGLGTPKSQLYFDIQALIAENGGRNRLAERLRNEWAKTCKPQNYPTNLKRNGRFYTQHEIIFIKENYQNMPSKQIAKKLHRSEFSVRSQVYKIQQRGELIYKFRHESKDHYL